MAQLKIAGEGINGKASVSCSDVIPFNISLNTGTLNLNSSQY